MSYFEYNDVYAGAGQPGGAYRCEWGRKEHDYEDNFGAGALAEGEYCI